MMKRRWSNNGGFAYRMLEESSPEVTSSSNGLVMPSSMIISPTSLGGSPDYNDMDLWYDETPYTGNVITGATNLLGNTMTNGGLGNGQCGGITTTLNGPQQTTTIMPLPSMTGTMNHMPRSESANSISSGRAIFFSFICFSIISNINKILLN